MSRILQLRDAVVVQIRTLAPGLDVQPHLGRFDEGELRAFMLKAPGVRVAVLGLDDVKPNVNADTVDACVRLGIYVVTKDGVKTGDRTDQALGLTEAIVLLCERNRWGLGAFVLPGRVPGAQLIYSQVVRDSGVALWAIDLRQPIRLSSLEPEHSQLTQAFAAVAPNVGPDHIGDYDQVGARQDQDGRHE